MVQACSPHVSSLALQWSGDLLFLSAIGQSHDAVVSILGRETLTHLGVWHVLPESRHPLWPHKRSFVGVPAYPCRTKPRTTTSKLQPSDDQHLPVGRVIALAKEPPRNRLEVQAYSSIPSANTWTPLRQHATISGLYFKVFPLVNPYLSELQIHRFYSPNQCQHTSARTVMFSSRARHWPNKCVNDAE